MTRALIVIDVQEDYFPGGVLPLHDAAGTEARLVAAIGKARAAGDKIILVRHVSDAPSGLFAANGTGIAIRPDILAATQEAPIVTKRFADAFQETDLAQHLEGISALLIAGMMTQNCVAFTALPQIGGKYAALTVIGDLCAAPSEIVHRIALKSLGSKLSVLQASEVWG